MKKDTTKSRVVNYHVMPSKLWRKLKKHLPKQPKPKGAGRPRVQDRDVINGIWYVLWTGCQWKAVKQEWFHVSSSTLHERFQDLDESGHFRQIVQNHRALLCPGTAHRLEMAIGGQQNGSGPLGRGKNGKNPTDRGKSGAKIHLLVDESGAPLAIHITGANEHDKWSVDDLVIHIAVKRPNSEQHFCGDKGYDYEDVHQFVKEQRYQAHIKHRRRRNEPKLEDCPIPGEAVFPCSPLGGGTNVRMVGQTAQYQNPLV